MTYRSIDISQLGSATPASQAAPQLIWADLADLVIDERYQRPLARNNLAAIKRIANNFRWSRFSPVLVAPVEGGRYAVIDGQHRVHAAAMCGFERVPAMVALVAPEEQALAFVEINTGQIKVSGHMVYKAALVAGEAWAIACRDTVAASGCRLMEYKGNNNSNKPGQVFAIGLIRKLVGDGHAAAVTAGLRAMLDADPESVANFDGTLLTPWLTAVASDPAFLSSDLSGFLRHKKPWMVLENADRYAKSNNLPKSTCRRDSFAVLLREYARAAA